MPTLLRVLIVLALIAALPAADAARTGRFTTTYSETSPLSAWSVYRERVGHSWGMDAKAPEGDRDAYRIAEEPFDLYVPPSYDGSVPFGIVAYVNSGDGGGPPGGYEAVCAKHRLLWIGGTRIGNERAVSCRTRLTVDGVHNLRRDYRVDAERIYVMGQSGGGRTASQMAVPYADLFAGGAIYLIGCNQFSMPPDKVTAQRLEPLSKAQRFAFVTGSEDYNKPGTQQVHAAYQSLKFPHLIYLEQPGLGHSTPDAAWFEKAIAFVDSVPIQRATAALAAGTAAEAKKKLREAHAAYRAAMGCAVADAVTAEARSGHARVAALLDAEASTELERLLAKPTAAALRGFVGDWPDLPSVARAREAADRLGGEELDKLSAAGTPGVSAVRGFLKTWDGYPVAERAVGMLETLAAPAWAKVAEMKPGAPRTKALARFAAEWAPAPAALAARATLQGEVDAELAAIAALPSPQAKAKRLQALLLETKGTPVAAPVEAAATALADELKAAKPGR